MTLLSTGKYISERTESIVFKPSISLGNNKIEEYVDCKRILLEDEEEDDDDELLFSFGLYYIIYIIY